MNFPNVRILSLMSVLVMSFAGCTTHRVVSGTKNPEVAITSSGRVEYRGKTVDPDDLPDLLEEAGLESTETVTIRVPADLKDYRMPYYVMGVLAKNGFRRPVLVKERRSYTVTGAGARAAGTPGARTVDGLLKKDDRTSGR